MSDERRATVKQVAKANRSLKRQVAKETKRRETLERLSKENQELSYRLLELRDDRIPYVPVRSQRNNTGEID
jgi:predicted RNase H-like nuclease (RuvC/YqgF family)